ncbi:hypothetical protein HPB49_020986 [Dermacentor silvarum]|uniref:Uncharacterized protein n=1 Tax=Dermacentor silvarum TaxID=543639 RepID=A0ACB8CBC4_DERSI|nr:hypothetical protein HPB49_020986 [Dermacentor silvarum]
MSTREQRVRTFSKRRSRRHDEPRTDAPSWEYDGRPPSSWLPCAAASGREQGGAETAGRDVDHGSNSKSRRLHSFCKGIAGYGFQQILDIYYLKYRPDEGESATIRTDASSDLVFGTTLRLPGQFFEASPIPPLDVANYASRLGNAMRDVSPILPRQHSRPSFTSRALRDFRSPLQPPYDGPFKVVKRCPKHFVLLLNGREDSVSVDRIKPAFLDTDARGGPMVSRQRLDDDDDDVAPRLLRTFELSARVERRQDGKNGGKSNSSLRLSRMPGSRVLKLAFQPSSSFFSSPASCAWRMRARSNRLLVPRRSLPVAAEQHHGTAYAQLHRYAKTVEDIDLCSKLTFVDDHGHDVPRYVQALRLRCSGDEQLANVVFSTAHKAKGLEFDTVFMADDFYTGDIGQPQHVARTQGKSSPCDERTVSRLCGCLHAERLEEYHVLYVAVTRARRSLRLSRALYFLLVRAQECFEHLRRKPQAETLSCLICHETWMPQGQLVWHREALTVGNRNVAGGTLCKTCALQTTWEPPVEHRFLGWQHMELHNVHRHSMAAILECVL